MSVTQGPHCEQCESAPCACPWEERKMEFLSESDWQFIAAADEEAAQEVDRAIDAWLSEES